MDNSTTVLTHPALKGGEWLIKESNPSEIFIPEQFNEEQKMVMDMCHQFMETEIIPNYAKIEKDPLFNLTLLAKAGEQGLLGVSVPAIYGGLEKDFVTSSIVMEGLGRGSSFSVSYLAHTGI